MSYDKFLIICAVLIAIPFLVSCIKCNPLIGVVVGFVSFLIMSLIAGHGGTMFEVHAVGFIIAGLGIVASLHYD